MPKQAKKLYATKLHAGETRGEYKIRVSKTQSTTPSKPGFKFLMGIGHFQTGQDGHYQKEIAVVRRSHKRAGWTS